VITVDDILREKRDTRIIAIRVSDTVAKATLFMKRENVSSVLVMDECASEHGTVIGVFSERDVARAVLEHGAATPDMVLASFLERELICCEPSDSIVTALRLMNEHQVRHLPVIEAGKESLSPILPVVKPSKPRSTMKPRISPSSLAHTTARSAMGELVIQYLPPFRR